MYKQNSFEMSAKPKDAIWCLPSHPHLMPTKLMCSAGGLTGKQRLEAWKRCRLWNASDAMDKAILVHHLFSTTSAIVYHMSASPTPRQYARFICLQVLGKEVGIARKEKTTYANLGLLCLTVRCIHVERGISTARTKTHTRTPLCFTDRSEDDWGWWKVS